MRNIPYDELRDDILDRLDNFTMTSGRGAEMLRQKKNAPVVIARAISAGIIEFCRQINYTSVPDLIQTVDLPYGITLDNLYSYPFPSDAMHEREDAGVITFIINGEEVDFKSGCEYDQAVAKSRLRMYNGKEPIFSIDVNKRTIYVAKATDVKAKIFKRPHSAVAPSQNMFHGVTLSGNASTFVTLSDGVGGSVTAQGQPATLSTAINNAESFAYNAKVENGVVTLYIRSSATTDVKLNPTITGYGFTLIDKGTVEIPIPYHFIDTIASTAFAILLDTTRRQPRRPESDEDNE